MTSHFRRLRMPLAVVTALTLVSAAAAATPPDAGVEDAAIVHVLNRLGYGPRPGDVERIRTTGLRPWIDAQLQPARIRELALPPRLAALATHELSVPELVRGYELPREAKREIAQRLSEADAEPSASDRMQIRRELRERYGDRMKGAPRQVVEELQQAKLLRAVYAERQLDEVLVDFWLNHFNVYAAKGPVRFLAGAYEREVIRPHAWGRFEDLLMATAKSPAMLFYLDNWLSADPEAASRAAWGRRRLRAGTPPAQGMRRGLNENYARELMELHTIGVDGGYSQDDVTEVARVFTGWTLANPRGEHPRFVFDPRLHASGDKRVLGRTIRGGGLDEGEQVIRLLAAHPSTARLVAFKLVRRFVADEPPAALVDRAAETFRRTGGHIRAVVETIVTSPEFLGPQYRAAKVKTPLEFVASAVRATGAEVTHARALARRVAEMGMPLYLQQPPTGYQDTSEAWVSTSGLLARLNFSLDLAAGRLPGTRVPEGATPALVLGSPEFQRR